MSLAIGSTLAHFEILAQLGKGGMGEVFRARDTEVGREVAIPGGRFAPAISGGSTLTVERWCATLPAAEAEGGPTGRISPQALADQRAETVMREVVVRDDLVARDDGGWRLQLMEPAGITDALAASAASFLNKATTHLNNPRPGLRRKRAEFP